MLEERRRLGIDGRDEMWDGVVHMVPPAGDAQQEVQADLYPVLYPAARRRGLVPRFETGLYRTAEDYKVPDQLYCRPDQRTARGGTAPSWSSRSAPTATRPTTRSTDTPPSAFRRC